MIEYVFMPPTDRPMENHPILIVLLSGSTITGVYKKNKFMDNEGMDFTAGVRWWAYIHTPNANGKGGDE
jgi:hypothetical protein